MTVLKFEFQLAAAIGVGTLQAAAANNRIDETSRRVGTAESDITKLKSTGTAEAVKVTGLTKDVADLKTSLGDSGSGLTKDVKDLKTTHTTDTDGLRGDVTKLTAACNKVSTTSI